MLIHTIVLIENIDDDDNFIPANEEIFQPIWINQSTIFVLEDSLWIAFADLVHNLDGWQGVVQVPELLFVGNSSPLLSCFSWEMRN